MINDVEFNGTMLKEISDIGIVAYLLSRGLKMIKYDRKRDGKTMFYFLADADVEAEIMTYLNRQGMVEAQGFVETLRNVKALTRKNGTRRRTNT